LHKIKFLFQIYIN